MVNKQEIVSELEQRGEQEAARQAEARLPEQVHLGNHEVQLRQLGLDPNDLAAKYLNQNR